MKAQMSLEMVIGLLILLIVAAVVINLFLTNSNIGNFTKSVKSSLSYRNFKSSCDSACQDYLGSGSLAAAAKFCFAKMPTTPDIALNKPFPADTMLLDVCPDAVYCFHVTTCQSDTQQIDITNCRQVLCNAYYQVYQDYNLANDKVKAYFPNGIGSCSLPAGDANWFQLYFGSNPCTQGPGVSGTSSSTTTTSSAPSVVSVSCSNPQGTKSISCNWVCPNAVSTQNQGIISISPGGYQQVSTSTGTTTFSDLNSGSYKIDLICDPSQGQFKSSTTVQVS
jgi:hypothetical protein